MDVRKRLEIMNNIMSLLVRAEIRGGEAKPTAEAIDFAKALYDEAQAAVAELVKQEEEAKNGEEQK